MKKYILSILAVLIAWPAIAADPACNVPVAARPKALELCEILRLQHRVRLSDWNIDICPTEVFRLGLLTVVKAKAKRAAQVLMATMVRDAVALFEADHPSIMPPPVQCGDGTHDAEYGEGCDDGNLKNGDGCSDVCQTE